MMAITLTQSNSSSSSPQVAGPMVRVAETMELLGVELDIAGSADFSLFSSPRRSATPPPLDEVTVYSCTETDDSSTCSAVSLDDEGVISSPASPRSIFQCYWDKHERKVPSLPLLRHSSSSSSEHSSSDTHSKISYDGILRTHEQAERPNTNNCRRRRRIFIDMGCSPQASSSVPQEVQSFVRSVSLREREVRKTKSAPGLVFRPGASCLRKQGTSRRCRSGSESSVTFSDRVDVVYFERPKENWASDGWSKFFSF